MSAERHLYNVVLGIEIDCCLRMEPVLGPRPNLELIGTQFRFHSGGDQNLDSWYQID
jgi:hypothetical protein